MKTIAAVGLLLLSLNRWAVGQVLVKITPEPAVTVTSVIANAHKMTRYKALGCNIGQTQMTVTSLKQIDIASPLPFISNADANQVLTSQAKASGWAKVARGGTIVVQLLAAGLAAGKVIPVGWATGMAVAPPVIQQVVSIAQGQVPNPAVLFSSSNYPVILNPADCFEDYLYTGTMVPSYVTYVTIPANGPIVIPTPSPNPAPQLKHQSQVGMPMSAPATTPAPLAPAAVQASARPVPAVPAVPAVTAVPTVTARFEMKTDKPDPASLAAAAARFEITPTGRSMFLS